jgi:hypothetical protein
MDTIIAVGNLFDKETPYSGLLIYSAYTWDLRRVFSYIYATGTVLFYSAGND